MVIFAGTYMAKRLKVISGALITKQDRKLIEKAKRALGFASETYLGPADADQGGEPVSLKDSLLGTLQSLGKIKRRGIRPKECLIVARRESEAKRRKAPAINPNTMLSSSGAGQFKPLELDE